MRTYISATSPKIAVGEFWTECRYTLDGSLEYDQGDLRQKIINWINATDGTSAAFDFATKGMCTQGSLQVTQSSWTQENL